MTFLNFKKTQTDMIGKYRIIATPFESMLVVFTVFSDILYIKLTVDHSVLLTKLSGYVVTLKTGFFLLITQYIWMKIRQEIIWMHFMPLVF